MKLHGLIFSFDIYVSESDLYIPTIGLSILLWTEVDLCGPIGGPIVGMYKSLTDS